MEVGKIYYNKSTDLYIKILSASLKSGGDYNITCYKNYGFPDFNNVYFIYGTVFPKDWVLYINDNLKTRSGHGINLPNRLK